MSADPRRYNPAEPHLSSAADSPSTVLGLRPGGRIDGELRVPGSKSIAQRVLVAAALSGGSTAVVNLPDGDDVVRAVELVERCCASVERLAPRAVRITGRPPGPHRGLVPGGPVDVGESGTLARLATAALAFCARAGESVEIHARGTLRARKSAALFRTLADAGVELRAVDADARGARVDGWPVRVTPIGPPSALAIANAKSSQEVSALLLALAAYPDRIELAVRGGVPSRPYLELTCDVLARFGVEIERAERGDAELWRVRGPLVPPQDPLAIEPDASSAAVALAAACVGGGSLRVPSLGRGSRQGDVRIVEHLRSFGCEAEAGDASISARGRPTRGADLDLRGEPDLAPVLAAVAAAVALTAPRDRARTRLRGLGTLQGKESARVSVLAGGLTAIGLAVRATDDELVIGPGAAVPRVREFVLDPHGDHRMAFAFALLGLCVEGVRVADAACVAKSWPTFWRDIERAGALVAR